MTISCRAWYLIEYVDGKVASETFLYAQCNDTLNDPGDPDGSGGESSPIVVNLIKDPCLRASVGNVLATSKNITGTMATIVSNFINNKSITINVSDGETKHGTRADTNYTSFNPKQESLELILHYKHLIILIRQMKLLQQL